MNKTDRTFFIIGLILLSGLIALGVFQYFNVIIFTELGLPCSFRRATGLYCPGCGGTHAVYDLIGGHFISCLNDHPFVAYIALFFTIYLIWNTFITIWNHAKNVVHTKLPALHFRTYYVYIGITILLLQWIIKNVLLLIFNIYSV